MSGGGESISIVQAVPDRLSTDNDKIDERIGEVILEF